MVAVYTDTILTKTNSHLGNQSAMAKPFIQISIESYADTEREVFGRQFIENLCQEALLVPELVSISERCRDPFIGIEHFIAKWWAIPVKVNEDGRFSYDLFPGSILEAEIQAPESRICQSRAHRHRE